jgi:glutathione S-transferase
MIVIGTHVSPYARKVYVALDLKGVDYEVDPIVPFFGNDEFSRLSPLRRIPVLIHGELVLNDSSVICEYIDESWPEPPLMPRTPAERAKARWLEEYADSRLGDLIIWRLFYQHVIGPRIFGQEADPSVVAKVTGEDLPAALDWIEGQAPDAGFLFDHLCMADVTYAAFFRNAQIAGFAVDPGRWPRTAAWLARVEAVPTFARTIRFEQAILKVRTHERGDALRAMGVKIVEKSVGQDTPRASIMLEQG